MDLETRYMLNITQQEACQGLVWPLRRFSESLAADPLGHLRMVFDGVE